MVLFAGIHEVTKELDDLAVYNFKSKKWYHMFNEPPMQKPLIQNPLDSSPTKLTNNSIVSPIKKVGGGLGQKNETTACEKKKPKLKDDKNDNQV